jgi:hypothetical protein
MATVEQPITRTELRAELDVRLQHYATKADLYLALVQLGIFMTGVVGAAVAFLKLTGGAS